MRKKTKISKKIQNQDQTPEVDITEITKLVAKRLDLENPYLKQAYIRFITKSTTIAQLADPANKDVIVKELTSCHTKMAIIDYIRAEIVENAIKLSFEGAETVLQHFRKRLEQAIDKHEDLCENTIWDLDLAGFRVIARGKAATGEDAEAFGNVANQVLKLTNIEIKEIVDKKILPRCIKRIVETSTVREYFVFELAEFVFQNNTQGRQIIQEILKNKAKTQYCAYNPANEIPVLTFLAQQVLLSQKIKPNQVN